MLPKIRLNPTPYAANTSACTANEVVKGESPNQTNGRTARITAVATIGRSAQPTLPDSERAGPALCRRRHLRYRPSSPRGRIRIVRAAAPSRMIVVMYWPM